MLYQPVQVASPPSDARCPRSMYGALSRARCVADAMHTHLSHTPLSYTVQSIYISVALPSRRRAPPIATAHSVSHLRWGRPDRSVAPVPTATVERAGPFLRWGSGRADSVGRSVGRLERWCDEVPSIPPYYFTISDHRHQPPSSTSRRSSYPYPEYLPYPLLRPECCIMPSSPSYIYITQWSSSPGPSLSLHLPGSFHMFLGLRLPYPRTPRGSPTIYSS